MRAKYLYALAILITIGLSTQQAIAATSSGTSAETTSSSADTAYFKRIGGSYTDFAGSTENLQSLASGLRHGSAITLTNTTSTGAVSSVTFTSPTRPMGYGNISRALDFANRDLAAAGITDPTAEQLQAALMGGTVVNSQGQVITMDGILQLRSQGMGWGQIAHQVGISPAASSKGQHATLNSKANTATSTSQVSKTGKAGGSAGGLTTAAGKTSNAGSNAKANVGGRSGIVSAAGNKTTTSGVVSASGNSSNGLGNAYGHGKTGIVTAGGSNANYSGITTGSGSSSASVAAGTHTALGGGSGNGNAFGHAKGKD